MVATNQLNYQSYKNQTEQSIEYICISTMDHSAHNMHTESTTITNEVNNSSSVSANIFREISSQRIQYIHVYIVCIPCRWQAHTHSAAARCEKFDLCTSTMSLSIRMWVAIVTMKPFIFHAFLRKVHAIQWLLVLLLLLLIFARWTVSVWLFSGSHSSPKKHHLIAVEPVRMNLTI